MAGITVEESGRQIRVSTDRAEQAVGARDGVEAKREAVVAGHRPVPAAADAS